MPAIGIPVNDKRTLRRSLASYHIWAWSCSIGIISLRTMVIRSRQ